MQDEPQTCGAIQKPFPGARFAVTHICGREPNHFGYHCCEICDHDWGTFNLNDAVEASE